MPSIVVVAASSGGVEALERLAAALPSSCDAAIFIMLHVGALPSILPQILQRVTVLPVAHASEGQPIEPGRIYVAPPDQHLLIEAGHIRLSRGPKVKHSRPAADPMFISAAQAYGERVVGIVLTGWDGDGADGLRAIKQHGGFAMVQDPTEAAAPEMPMSALAADHPDLCLPLDEIAARLRELCAAPVAADAAGTQAPDRHGTADGDGADVNGSVSPS
jgi:two-component system, chemotaxis family, protein-glutamate methylesterase/glutaminase